VLVRFFGPAPDSPKAPRGNHSRATTMPISARPTLPSLPTDNIETAVVTHGGVMRNGRTERKRVPAAAGDRVGVTRWNSRSLRVPLVPNSDRSQSLSSVSPGATPSLYPDIRPWNLRFPVHVFASLNETWVLQLYRSFGFLRRRSWLSLSPLTGGF